MGLLKALQEGEELENSTLWKNRAIVSQAVASVIGAGVAVAGACGVRVDLDADAIATIAGGVVALVALLSAVAHLATSRRVGVRKKGGA